MKIVITDGATLNPGDLDWTPLAAFGEVVYFDTTPKEMAAQHCSDATIIITNKTIISAETIRGAANLRLIAVSATGYNNVDLPAAQAAGVVVCNVPEYGTFSVAQHTFALLLELVNHVCINSTDARNDGWADSGTWSFTRKPIRELKDKTLGIVGFGRIGRQVATLGRAFGMSIIFSNRSVISDADARQVAVNDLFRDSDVVSLHCPLTQENKHFVNRAMLSSMKPSAFLINTSRGPLIQEDDLLQVLHAKQIAGAALDVLSEEPPRRGHPLFECDNCIITPHTAWISVEGRRRLMASTIKNIGDFLQGHPQNVVGG